MKSVPAVTGNWSGTEDVSDEEIDEALARADESMEAEKASLRLQAATTSTEQEPMEIPGDDIPVATTQEVYTVEESDDEVDLIPPNVIFDLPYKVMEPVSPASDALLTINEDEIPSQPLSSFDMIESIDGERENVLSQSLTTEIRSEVEQMQLDQGAA